MKINLTRRCTRGTIVRPTPTRRQNAVAGTGRLADGAGAARGGGSTAVSWLRIERSSSRELGARLEAQLVAEKLAGLTVDLERVHLATGPIQRQHQLADRALPRRMLADQPFELADQPGVLPQPEIGVDAVLQHRQP